MLEHTTRLVIQYYLLYYWVIGNGTCSLVSFSWEWLDVSRIINKSKASYERPFVKSLLSNTSYQIPLSKPYYQRPLIKYLLSKHYYQRALIKDFLSNITYQTPLLSRSLIKDLLSKTFLLKTSCQRSLVWLTTQ